MFSINKQDRQPVSHRSPTWGERKCADKHSAFLLSTVFCILSTSKRRSAFTLVEMLVSVALTLFIMALLSQAFVAGLQAFRQMKALGDMEERLRSTSAILRRDLTAFHFEGVRKLSDSNFWSPNYGGGPPAQGFFRIWESGPSTLEGTDGDGIPSTNATTHMLDFTCKLLGLAPNDFASAYFPPSLQTALQTANQSLYGTSTYDGRYISQAQATTLYRSRWFEVAYFLRPSLTSLPSGTQLYASANVPLYTLYRRQLAVIDPLPPIAVTSSITDWPNYFQLSASSSASYAVTFNKPDILTSPARRFAVTSAVGVPVDTYSPSLGVSYPIYPYLGESGGASAPLPWQENASYLGSDVLLTDVISFDVKVLTNDNPGDFTDLFHQAGFGGSNSTLASLKPAPTLPAPMVFDTWSSVSDGTNNYSNWGTANTPTSAPMLLHIQALKITIRIWDNKTRQARQVTILQDM